MESTLMNRAKTELTEKQEVFLDKLFGDANGNPKIAGELAGYSKQSYPKVVRNLKKEIIQRAENYLAVHAPKAAMQITGMMDDNAILPQANIRLEAAKQVLDRIGIVKKDQIDINMKAVHGLFILPKKDDIKDVLPPLEELEIKK